ncbi:tripartite tricarboxylate transporter TctB family protein [Jannaschia marina]|uniref:tripartite tricarboxylate transporter TctB family protein n=1 Tax=Jannaschia marina TaxID=2741674 RepID=UPI0015C710B9|nr:tripartite tricarboxylate transporter TctB family protein [Jannaschia marina]
MKTGFAAALLVLAICYTVYGLATLSLFTQSGRPAAGFFPLLVGLALIVSCGVNLWGDLRDRRAAGGGPVHRADPTAEGTAEAMGLDTHALDGGPEYGRDVAITFGYLCVFVAALKIAGALPAMIFFMLAFLFTFNRGHPVGNLIYSLALPGFLYLLFKVLLNASLPIGPLGV